jgi:SAM-dependent methyltransferase
VPEHPTLAFTGERFTPECVREMRYEHWHRYAFAAGLARGKRVLDAACGEGYGSALLARHGAEVVGVDVSAEAIAHARARYGESPQLRFVHADCTALDDFDGPGFDLIASFETLEHLQAQDRMLAGFARLLEQDGLLLVSSPDRATYSDARGYSNEFHVRELYRHELEALLSRHFPAFRLFGQKLLFQSALWALDREHGPYAASTLSGEEARLAPRLDYPPLYFVAACAHRPERLHDLPALSLFGDAEESVYSHYDNEVRKNMAAGARIAELERQLAELEARLRGQD